MPPFRLRRLAPGLVIAALGLAIAAPWATGASSTPSAEAVRLERLRRIKEFQRQKNMEEGYEHLERGRKAKRLLAAQKKAKPGAQHPGFGQRKAIEEIGRVRTVPRPFAMPNPLAAGPAMETAAAAIGPNVLVNDTTNDRVQAYAQSEPAIGAYGDHVLVAWNDGRGFDDPQNRADYVGFGYSNDGGATFVDGGDLPAPAANVRWSSDPVITVNEKTGEFFFVSLIEATNRTSTGLGIIRGTFSGTTFTWDTPKVIRSENASTTFIDKPWAVADSSSGRVYVSYTRFYVGGDVIEFQRSTTNWATWSTAVQMNTVGSNGFVQGSRPAVGPGGQVYVVWKQIDLTSDGADLFMIRKSTNQGGTFSPEVTATAIYDNFGTGAPGFNRERGITFPSIAVDRSFGPNRGRVYLAWNECLNWYKDVTTTFGGAGVTNEVEPNPSPANATPFTIGRTLIGGFANVGDVDFWRFTATVGTTYTFWCDSIPTSLYSMRIICSDDTTRLNLAGDFDTPTGGLGFITWTCPRNGSYTIRMFNNLPDNPGGGYYRILTGANTHAGEPGRDQRDVMVVSSDDGISWGSPVRVNTDAPRFDNWLPEVAVAGDGRVYTLWYGFHEAPDTTCGGESDIYLARSDDAGLTWRDVGKVSTANSPWTRTFSNIQPNQGDYAALYTNHLTLYGAWSDGRFGNPDILTLTVPLATTPTLVSLASVAAEPGRVTITWYAASQAVTEAYVYRREGEDWVLRGVILPDGSRNLRYVDTDVDPGVRYQYRVGIRDGGVEVFLGQTAVVVPTLDRLRLDEVHPNPTAKDLWVSFSLPTSRPARLSLVDIAGRMVRSRDVGTLGKGRHVIELSEGRQLPTGVYIVRLEQDGLVQTARASVVR